MIFNRLTFRDHFVWVSLLIGLFACPLPGQSVGDIRLIQKLGKEDALDQQLIYNTSDTNQQQKLLNEIAQGIRDHVKLLPASRHADRIAELRSQIKKSVNEEKMPEKMPEKLTGKMIAKQVIPAYQELEKLIVPSRSELFSRDVALLQKVRVIERTPKGKQKLAQLLTQQLNLLIAPDETARLTLTNNQALADQLDKQEIQAILTLNRMRMVMGLVPLRIDEKLAAAARDHSQSMSELHYFSHESPEQGKRTVDDRAGQFEVTASAENIATGIQLGEEAVLSWFRTPDDLKNMLGDYQRIGLGNYKKHWTMMLGE